MGSCCFKDEVIIDSEKIMRSYDSISNLSNTPYYQMPNGHKRVVFNDNQLAYKPHSF